jgi:glutamyl-tRNA(Gln) amidotransferase subunit D
MNPDIIDALVDLGYRGLFGPAPVCHVNKPLYPAIERAHAKGVHMYMSVQTLWDMLI